MQDDLVADLFDRLANLGPAEREAFWRAKTVPVEVRAEVESLLAYDDGASGVLREGVGAAAAAVVTPSEDWRALKCGAYRLTEVIGRGGMGVVYRAERDDGQVTHSAAVKLLPAGFDDPAARALFLRERQILAGLSHPGIARLLDAGQIEGGRPFLVMEHVQGVPIDEFVQDLPLHAKLRLFLGVCRAVSYAHANLVVHRDIKPSNVLVTPDGEAKLLDFGIARMADTQASQATVAIRLTPDFASPEQVTGTPPSASMDIYSLGAVLYLLLTGEKPHRIESRTPAAIEAAICRVDPIRPSHHTPALRGDLDSILLKALRKEPGERYASVEKFAEDIDAFLSIRPVHARAGEFGYAARKFARRYWLPAGALTIAIAGLAAGLVVARRERVEAQERFNQVRQLSQRLFEIDSDIKFLSGSAPARNRIVKTALEYLENLGRSAAGNEELAVEIASGYRQVAQLQGVASSVAMGQTKEAEKSLISAENILRPFIERGSANPEVWLAAASLSSSRLGVAQTDWRPQDAFNRASEAVSRIDRAQALGLRKPADIAVILTAVAGVYQNYYRIPEAARLTRRAVEAAREAGNPAILVPALNRHTFSLRLNGEFDAALATVRESRETSRKIPATPGRGEPPWLVEFGLLSAEGTILGGEMTVSLNRPDESAVVFQRAIDLANDFASRDRGDHTSRVRLCTATRFLAEVLTQIDPARALAALDLCVTRLTEIPLNPNLRVLQAASLGRSAAPLRKLGQTAEAGHRLERAIAVLEPLGEKPEPGGFKPGSGMEDVVSELALHFAATGRSGDAIPLLELILGNIKRSPDFHPESDLRHANVQFLIFGDLAKVYRAEGRIAEAAELEQRRLNLWDAHDKLRPNNPFVMRRLAAARTSTNTAKK